jgi:hypothetical protein
MKFSPLNKICTVILLLSAAAGCSGAPASNYEKKVTFLAKSQVVSGLIYGYGNRTVTTATAESSLTTFPTYMSIASGQYAMTNYPVEGFNNEVVFYATFSDNSRLYSVWSGTPTPTADVTLTYNDQEVATQATVNPDFFNARANINPVTDLAFWFWLHDNRRSPYSDYLTRVFQFFQDLYFIPAQNAVHDYPGPELVNLLKTIQIKTAADISGFTLVNSATGKTICTATFNQFPACQ